MNQFTFSGNVGKDPVITQNEDPKKVRANFSVAVKTDYKKDSEPVWISVTAFGSTAGYVEKYINKGSKVLVVGPLSTYASKDGGTQLSVTANTIEGLGAHESGGGIGGNSHQTSQPKANVIDDTDSIPF